MDDVLWLRHLLRGLAARLDAHYSQAFGRWTVVDPNGSWRWSIVPVAEGSWVLSFSLTTQTLSLLRRGEDAWRRGLGGGRWLVSGHAGALHVATKITWADRLEVDTELLEWIHHRAGALVERLETSESTRHFEPATESLGHRDAPRPSTLRPPRPGPTERVDLRATPRTPSERPIRATSGDASATDTVTGPNRLRS
jgi:hypothetical protein